MGVQVSPVNLDPVLVSRDCQGFRIYIRAHDAIAVNEVSGEGPVPATQVQNILILTDPRTEEARSLLLEECLPKTFPACLVTAMVRGVYGFEQLILDPSSAGIVRGHQATGKRRFSWFTRRRMRIRNTSLNV